MKQHVTYFFTALILFNMQTISAFDHFIDEQEVPECKTNLLIDSIKEKYELTINGIDCLFYPAKKPKRLYILFTGAVSNIYTMYSWFWDPKESWEHTSYLFLKDDDIRGYLGTEEHPLLNVYQSIIEYIIEQNNIPNHQVFTIGLSMGGFAAIYFALKMGLGGAFAMRPQINWKHASHFFSSKKLENLWIDLDKMLHQTKHFPILYIQYGEYPADRDAAYAFLEALKHIPSFAIIEKLSNQNHSGYYPSKEFIVSTLIFMEQIRNNI